MKFSLLSLLVLTVACSGPFKATENSTEFFKATGNDTSGFIPLTSGANGGQAAGDNGGADNGGADNGGEDGGSGASGSASGGTGSASGGVGSASGGTGSASGGTGSASGGTASGGSDSGGANTGGYNGFGTGGASSSGGAETGSSSGGALAGSASGGTVSGGASTGGGNTGSSNSGGSSGAGSASGGTVSGGSSSGGNSGGYNGFGTGGASSSGGSESGSSSAGGYNGGYNGGTGGTGSATGGATGGACEGKVKVCHREGNGSSHTIEIACPALPAHLAHGDVQGECSSTSGGTTGGYVCDPMDDNPPGTIADGYGLVGDVWDGKGKIQKFEDATKKGDKMPYTIYMSQLNVPTRLFNEGFAATDGKLVMNSQNQPMFENFAIEFTSNLVLRPEDEEGYYQIGTLADDGVRVEITPINDKQMTLAVADYETPTKFTCGKKLVRMERNKKVPVKIRYFQGPRFHISLVMLWRKVKSLSSSKGGCHHEEPPKEVKCGIAGNKYWFDPDNASTPTANYLELLDPSKRQVPWKLVQHKNFKLNNGDSNEECQD